MVILVLQSLSLSTLVLGYQIILIPISMAVYGSTTAHCPLILRLIRITIYNQRDLEKVSMVSTKMRGDERKGINFNFHFI